LVAVFYVATNSVKYPSVSVGLLSLTLAVLFRAACNAIGFIASYWNVPFFPEWCSNVELDDTETYNTVVRVSGGWAGIADALKQVLDLYGWHHTVYLSNERGRCYFGGVPIKALLSTAANFSFYWISMASEPTDAEIEDYLHQIRIRTRGSVAYHVVE